MRVSRSRDVIAARLGRHADKLAAEPNAGAHLPARRPRAAGGELFRNPDLANIAAPYRGTWAGRFLRRNDRRRHPCGLERDKGGTMTAADLKDYRARMGRADLDHVPRLDGVRAAAQHARYRCADDAQLDGAVSARRVRPPQREGPARDDRGQEARVCRHAPLRWRYPFLDSRR